MNPSAFSCHHTTIYTYSCTSTGACSGPYQPCTAYAPTLYEDPSSSTDGWSGESLALGPWSDADQALLEVFLTADVTSSSPSGPCTLVPMQSLPYKDQEPCFLTSTSMASESSRLSHRLGRLSPSNPPYPSPSEPSPQMSSIVLTSQPRDTRPFTAQSPIELAPQQSFPETTCISPDFIYPSAHCGNDLEDDHPIATKSQSPRASHCRTHPRSSSLPYPSPSPEPSPRTSSIVIASQRRNSPACTAAPVSAQSWQCPHCPYIQRNRRSPDLKRHIKTHTRGAEVADWVCCGVPVLNATELGVPAATMREAEVFEFDGVLMVGGCRKAFSRRDALIRHLQREKGRCFGDAQSLYQRGNRESR